MKKINLVLLLAGLLCPIFMQAQGTLYLSNSGVTPMGSAEIGSDSWIGQSFYTGTNPDGYTLDSIQLLMNSAIGNPDNVTVSIYSWTSGTGAPGTEIASLTGFNPSTGGLYTYTASGITLLPSTDGAEQSYFVVVTASTPVAVGAYDWSAANTEQQQLSEFIQNDGWLFHDEYFSSTDGSTWTKTIRQDIFQMAIYATPIPEPQIYAVLGLSLAYIGFRRFRRSK
ncbi:MAG TPA: choice-of-anchor R domain-containing protein [Verrucomicrobiae bacterium]|nr:choice-of-anchor R domain-containing protein [Verrucomicrobiae bacterium]